jgi:lysozyme
MNLDALKKQLSKHEGLRLKPYKDTKGHLTIGVGRNLDALGISLEEAMLLLENDIEWVLDDLDSNLSWWRTQSEDRQLAMADMCFNLGIKGLLTFKNTLRYWQRGEYDKAADGILDSLYAKQVGQRAKTIAEMVRKG